MIRMLAWPDGARIASIAYLSPAGTEPGAWKRLLVGKYGAYSSDTGQVDGEGLHLRWCGRAACIGEGGLFRLVADAGARGGQITLSQPEGTSGRLTELVGADAARRGTRGAPSF